MSRAKVIYANGREQAIKNLGWLLRNWKSVERFQVLEPQIGGERCDAVLIAHCRDYVKADGSVVYKRYETCFASRTVLKDWLHRPVFRGVPTDWFGEKTQASPRPQNPFRLRANSNAFKERERRAFERLIADLPPEGAHMTRASGYGLSREEARKLLRTKYAQRILAIVGLTMDEIEAKIVEQRHWRKR